MNRAGIGDISIEVIEPRERLTEIKSLWQELEKTSDHSFFLSWAWIGTWLTCLPEDHNVRLVLGKKSDKPVLGFFIGEKTGFEHRMIYAHRAYLNTTGYERLDDITIEYNGVLFNTDSGHDWVSVFDSKPLRAIEEFVLQNITEKSGDYLIAASQRRWCSNIQEYISRYVDLQKVRESEHNIFGLLSKSKRSQIRRSIREYELDGTITISEAQDSSECREMLSELAILHNAEWKKRGIEGAFTNSFFVKFHEQLIERTFELGYLSIIKIGTPKRVIGYVYSLQFQNKMNFYQCGFNYQKGNTLRPGLVCHCLAINYYAKKGFDEYDFLKGDSQYKRSLATDQRKMVSLCLQKKKPKFFIESVLRNIKRHLNSPKFESGQ